MCISQHAQIQRKEQHAQRSDERMQTKLVIPEQNKAEKRQVEVIANEQIARQNVGARPAATTTHRVRVCRLFLFVQKQVVYCFR